MHIQRISDIFMEIAKSLYYYGESSTEIEDSLFKIAKTYGLDVQVAAMGTVIHITLIAPKGETISRIERVNDIDINFSKLELWEQLIRRIINEKRPLYKVKKDIIKIKNINEHTKTSIPLLIISVFIVSFSFCILFKGNFIDSIVSGISGVSSFIIIFKIKNRIFKDFMAGFLLHTFISIQSIFFNINLFPSLAGALMVFVPGLLLTNGILEIGERNLVSGGSKLLESMFILGALVMGAISSSIIWR
ncbi:hypothetical protein OSSY52_06220 [Tepiditoga spiralis]|uniref:Threonine/serine exporter-like N-terminal domain-containing protein n=1 Tax=Tepiditoga spiralis TaxID=2108365 RepID=A0A7G1G2D5_9BACT|nr:threonine/serine exporter family protein [Tepiditoga spiralis]BBE30481.1 hypothetical protein OSSY52_06220 [Tepiditoga spiralis]